jgi:hypothetical protein
MSKQKQDHIGSTEAVVYATQPFLSTVQASDAGAVESLPERLTLTGRARCLVSDSELLMSQCFANTCSRF